jgi:hypothetical protein
MKYKNPLKRRTVPLLLLLLTAIATSPLALAQTATLTLAGQVINDDGGTAVISDFTLYAYGAAYIEGVSGASSVTNASVPAGVYYLEQYGPFGYDTGTWACDGGSLSGRTLTLAVNNVATCVVTIRDVVQDLEANYLSFPEYTRNGSINVLGQVFNRGLNTSSGYQVSFRRSVDAFIDTSDTQFGVVSYPALEGGDYNFFRLNLDFPPELSSATPYWGFCIINAGAEATTENNCSDFRNYPVENGPSAPSSCSVSPLSCAGSVSGNLSTSDCESGPRGTQIGQSFAGTPDFLASVYEFQGTSGQTIDVFADWLNTVDGYLYLENPLGVIETLNDDYNGIALSLIDNHVLEQTGTYRLWVTTYSENQLGSYEISMSCDGVVVEPVFINNFIASPSLISEGEVVTLNWSAEGASRCFGEDGVAAWQGEKPATGNQSVVIEASGRNDFGLLCTNDSGGQASAMTMVDVQGNNPDLDLESLRLSISEATTSQILSATAIFRNTGDAVSDTTTFRWYLSNNEAISSSDQLLGTGTLASIAPGQSITLSRTGTAPAVAGSYWVGICADPVAGEPEIVNNCSSGALLTVVSDAACNIDMIECGATDSAVLGNNDCQSGPLGPGHFAAGRTFEGVAGQSFILDASWAGADGYLALQSPDGVTVSANDDFGLSTRSRIEYQLQQTGTYTAWLTTFAAGTKPAFDLTLACPEQEQPNLSVTLLNGPPAELEVGEGFQVEVGVDNIGQGSADASTLRYMLSTNASITPDDLQLAQSDVSSLVPSANTRRLALLEVTAPGDYWFGACIDSVDGEALAGNNCSSGQRVTVRSASNCNSSQVGVGYGAVGRINNEDCDQSPRGAAYYSESYTFEANEGQLIGVSVSWNDLDGYLYIEGPDGKVVAQNDDGYSNSVSEVLLEIPETGEYKAWATSYSPEASGTFELETAEWAACEAQLTADSITADKSSVSNGEQVTISTQVSFLACSEGGSEETLLRYFLSSNSKITSGDAEVGVDVIDSIQSGESRFEHVLVEAPVTSGNYWIGACVGEIDDNCVVTAPIEVQSDIENIPFNSGMNDAWWNPTQPGQGMLISIFPATKLIFMAWFTYDTELSPEGTWSNLGDPGHRWMTAYGFYEGNSATLNIEMTKGGVFNSNSPAVQQSNDGTVQIQFTDCNKGTILYDIPSIQQQGTVEIERVTRENLHLCESALTDTQQLQSSISIEADPPVLRTGERTVLSWQAPAGLNCTSTGGSGRWAEGMELESSGSYKVRIGTEGNHDFGMNCTNGISVESSVSANAHITAVSTEGDGLEQRGQKVLFNPGLNDAWFDPLTPGQGALLTVFPDSKLVFLAWFTFDTQRPPGNTPFSLGDPGHRWVTAYGFYDEDSVQLQMELTRGGIFDSATPQVSQGPYGTMDLSFANCDSGEMAYNIPSLGLSGKIPLKRGAPDKIEECQAQDGFDDPIDVLTDPPPKKLLPNSCGGSYAWTFEWEEQYGFNRYQVEIRNGRSDQPVYRESVEGTRLRLEKNEAISAEYLTGWSWRVRAIGGAVASAWSEEREFNVAPVTACD